MSVPVRVRNVVLGQGRPKICIPIVALDREGLIREAEEIRTLPADLVEWRADWYEVLKQPQKAQTAVNEGLGLLREILGEKMPVIFTVRTRPEGGAISLPAEDYVLLIRTALECGMADLVDMELFTAPEETDPLIGEAHSQGKKVILSSHDFKSTPPFEEMVSRLRAMEEKGGDILKLAVTPWSPEDVLSLLEATVKMKDNPSGCPLITMAMGGFGVVSRLTGEVFGSCMTFGCSRNQSAPGQIEAVPLARVLETIHQAMTGQRLTEKNS